MTRSAGTLRKKTSRQPVAVAALLALSLICLAPRGAYSAPDASAPSDASVATVDLRPEPSLDAAHEDFSVENAFRSIAADHIAASLAKADEYFRAGRVADPPEDSAYGLYLLVLGLDPQNESAQAGVKKVADYYRALGRRQLQSKSYEPAAQSFRKALLVNADDEKAEKGLREAEKLLKKQPPAKNAAPVEPSGASAASAPTSLDPETIESLKTALSEHMGRVKFCYAKNPDAKGATMIRFVINPDGSVSNVAIPDSTISDAEVEQCLARRVALMQFRAFTGPARTVIVPFHFNQ